MPIDTFKAPLPEPLGEKVEKQRETYRAWLPRLLRGQISLLYMKEDLVRTILVRICEGHTQISLMLGSSSQG